MKRDKKGGEEKIYTNSLLLFLNQAIEGGTCVSLYCFLF
jgi:hypothetical protein